MEKGRSSELAIKSEELGQASLTGPVMEEVDPRQSMAQMRADVVQAIGTSTRGRRLPIGKLGIAGAVAFAMVAPSALGAAVPDQTTQPLKGGNTPTLESSNGWSSQGTGLHSEFMKSSHKGNPACAPLGTLILRQKGNHLVPMTNNKGFEVKINKKADSQLWGLFALGDGDGNFAVKISEGRYTGKYVGQQDLKSSNPTAKGVVYKGLCKGADKYTGPVSPAGGGDPSAPGAETYPGDAPESSSAGLIVVTDENNDGAISYKGKILFRPICDNDTGANPPTISGFAAYGKGVPVLGAKANVIGIGYTSSLLGPIDPLQWNPVDTTNQISIPFPLQNLNKPNGAELRLTSRISTNLGEVNIVLRETADDCINRDDGTGSPTTGPANDPSIGGEAVTP